MLKVGRVGREGVVGLEDGLERGGKDGEGDMGIGDAGRS